MTINDLLHCQNAKEVALSLPSEETTERLATIFKVLSEPIRIKILSCMVCGEICVHDISTLLNISQPRISNQLRILRNENIVKTRKCGNSVFYSLSDESFIEILKEGKKSLSK